MNIHQLQWAAIEISVAVSVTVWGAVIWIWIARMNLKKHNKVREERNLHIAFPGIKTPIKTHKSIQPRDSKGRFTK